MSEIADEQIGNQAKPADEQIGNQAKPAPVHSLQVRQTITGELLSPNRDLRYVYPQIIQHICLRFNKRYWPALNEMLEKLGITFEKLVEANEAYIRFLNMSCEDPEESMEDVMRRAGWLDIPSEAQMGYCAMMGNVMSGQLFIALRDTTILGEAPKLPPADTMMEIARRRMQKTDV